MGAKVVVSADPEKVEKAGRLILPGVGAFSAGMRELRLLGLDEALNNVVKVGNPILGICLGMQMLMSISMEFGQHDGLDLVSGPVLPIPVGSEIKEERVRKVPHIGWTALDCATDPSNWYHSCLSNTPSGTFFYFVHSFMVVPDDPGCVLGYCVYERLPLVGAIRKGNITGLQFHPERSGPAGLAVLENFISS